MAEIATSAMRTFNASTTVARLHASRNFAYLTNGSGWSHLDVRNGGTISFSSLSSSAGGCGNLWVSEDGARVYTACGTVYRSSESPTEDGVANGSLSGLQSYGAGWIAHSSGRQQIAAVTGNYNYSVNPADVQLYAEDGLVLLGRVRLAGRADSSATFPVRARWVFWNQAANRLFAIIQAQDQNSGTVVPAPLSDFSLEVVSSDTIAGCAITVTPQTVNAPGGGGTIDLTIQTGAACVWNASVIENWVRLPGFSTYVGLGSGTVSLTVDRNPGTTARTVTVIVGGVAVTINQPLPNPLSVNPLVVASPSAGFTSTIGVTATGTGLTWTAVSNANWITILNGPNFVGTGTASFRVAANPDPNSRSGTMTIAGETVRVDQAGGAAGSGMRFVPVTPCRIVDTRALTGETGFFGLPVMEAGTQRDFPIPLGPCNIPGTAAAYSLNATVVPRGPLSYLTLWPTGQTRPLVSTLNSFDGRIKANAAIVPAGSSGSITAFVTDRTDVILDINGYFVPAGTTPFSSLFYSVAPCRVVDTRNASGANGAPSMTAGQTRSFVIAGACNGAVVSSAISYSLNVTVIPKTASLSYLTIWANGATQPIVSTLNAPTGTVVANAAIVPSGTGGSINVFATDATDVVIDINGYFTNGPNAGLSFYTVAPCRVSDSRNAAAEFGGPILQTGTRSYTVPASACGISVSAQAYSMNATVVPSGTLAYLTLWPTGQTQPVVSTLNSFDASVVSNALFVPTGTGGKINAYVTDQTHLILDINGFFAP